VQVRIAICLGALARRFGDNLPFSQRELANCAGTTAETTSRVLGRLKEQAVIGYTARTRSIQILDMDGLNQLAGGEEGWN
jgi:CRP-like cAMP-binding protein